MPYMSMSELSTALCANGRHLCKLLGWYINHIRTHLQTIIEVLDNTFDKVFTTPQFTYMIQGCEHLELFHESEFQRLSMCDDRQLRELTLRLLCTC